MRQVLGKSVVFRRKQITPTMLVAAFILVSKLGWHKLTVKSVIRLALQNEPDSVALPPTKRELTLAMLEDSQRVWRAQMKRSRKQGMHGEFALVALCEGLEKLFKSPNHEAMRGRLLLFFQLIGSEDALLRRAMIDAQAGLRAGLISVLEDGVRLGHFRTFDVDQLAILINAACRGIGYQWSLDPTTIDVGASLRALENLLVRALGSEDSGCNGLKSPRSTPLKRPRHVPITTPSVNGGREPALNIAIRN